ncbi:fimbrial protein [Enterobacter sp. C4G1]|uniref:fimbrial protein n=1 Tax=Enterobacter sp. C4G1 TaxID=3458724 RepID=UPI0040695AC2
MINKLFIFAIVAGSTFISNVNAADGKINFTGTITDVACTISSTTATQNIPMGNISTSSFNSAGDSAGPQKVSIVLTSCPSTAKGATVRFDGASHPDNSNLLAISAASGGTAASGVGIGFYEEDGTTLIPMASRSAEKILSSTADTTFNFIAKYVATAAVVTKGEANASTDFTIDYNF